jgi:prepilin-type N-terminal cleavage/methylation domain-containing protein
MIVTNKRQPEEGFTLIELLVVILIIAILAAVGIVALLGAIKSGQDSAAKQTIDKAYKEIITLDLNQDYIGYEEGVDPVSDLPIAAANTLNSISKDIEWSTTGIVGDPTNKANLNLTDIGFPLLVRSKSGRCFYFIIQGALRERTQLMKYQSTDSQSACEVSPAGAELADTDNYKKYK